MRQREIGNGLVELIATEGMTLHRITEQPPAEAITHAVVKVICIKDWTESMPALYTRLDYEQAVESKLRARYSINEELAVLRQRDSKPQEFEEYNAYAEQCKIEARAELTEKATTAEEGENNGMD